MIGRRVHLGILRPGGHDRWGIDVLRHQLDDPQTQMRDKHRESDRSKREALFNDFIVEASRLYGDALSREKDDASDMVQLYALLAKMRLLASRPVVIAAEEAVDAIIATYLAPNLSLHEIRNLAQSGRMNFVLDFGEACRAELAATSGSGPRQVQDRRAPMSPDR